MLRNMAQQFPYQPQVKNAHGLRVRKGTRIQKRLSCTDYPSKRRKAVIAIEDFDPRPAKYRLVKPEHVNELLQDLQSLSANKNESSIWETQLQLSYDD